MYIQLLFHLLHSTTSMFIYIFMILIFINLSKLFSHSIMLFYNKWDVIKNNFIYTQQISTTLTDSINIGLLHNSLTFNTNIVLYIFNVHSNL